VRRTEPVVREPLLGADRAAAEDEQDRGREQRYDISRGYCAKESLPQK
jgi:hypothetical protein